MKIKDINAAIDAWAPPELQEEYDNSGLQVGDPDAEVRAALVCLDCTEAVVAEAKVKGCDLIISHHPVIFKGLKGLTGRDLVERTVLAAIRNGIAILSIHTNLDNVIDGVNGEIAARMDLKPVRVLDPKPGQLIKLVVLVPRDHAEAVRNALFAAGAGHIGNYAECSFNTEGTGTFLGGEGAKPFVGRPGERHHEPEVRVEVIFRAPARTAILAAMRSHHPYEEVAHDLVPLLNTDPSIGSGLLAEWDEPHLEATFLARLKDVFGLKAVRHSALLGKPIRRVAICGGSGAFLLAKAKALGADAFITGDLKYHQYFDADGKLLLVDIGHYGSEQYTMHLIQRKLGHVLPTFAVRLTEIVTDPIYLS